MSDPAFGHRCSWCGTSLAAAAPACLVGCRSPRKTAFDLGSSGQTGSDQPSGVASGRPGYRAGCRGPPTHMTETASGALFQAFAALFGREPATRKRIRQAKMRLIGQGLSSCSGPFDVQPLDRRFKPPTICSETGILASSFRQPEQERWIGIIFAPVRFCHRKAALFRYWRWSTGVRKVTEYEAVDRSRYRLCRNCVASKAKATGRFARCTTREARFRNPAVAQCRG